MLCKGWEAFEQCGKHVHKVTQRTALPSGHGYVAHRRPKPRSGRSGPCSTSHPLSSNVCFLCCHAVGVRNLPPFLEDRALKALVTYIPQGSTVISSYVLTKLSVGRELIIPRSAIKCQQHNLSINILSPFLKLANRIFNELGIRPI